MSRGALTRAGFIALIITSGLLAGAGPAAAQIACTEAALRAAIDGAADGATITLPGNCIITLTGAADDDSNTSGDIDIAGNTAAATLTIQGAGVGSTIIDANGVDRGIDIGAGKTVTIKSLTLRGGDATQNAGTQDGGGIFFGGDSLTLQDVEIINNKANNGGGLFDFGGAITLTR
ncbi:MAG TPA: hypothetical protein VGX21_11280, partial [Methylomirabilota bacterium]|nr:hypothetical protein [Methylomirabilota bacterium]